jgi:hypothetical protein
MSSYTMGKPPVPATMARRLACLPAAAKVGASVTPGRASQKPSKGKVARQTTSP